VRTGSGTGATGHEGGIVFVAEDWGDDGNPSGRFNAHWESADGQDFRQGPEGVPSAQAVRWARRQAPVVVLRTGDGDIYSAGTEPADGVARQWPAGGLDFAPRSLASHWKVAIRVPTDGPLSADDALFRVIAGSSSVTEAQTSTRSDGARWVICTVAADSETDAAALANSFVPAGAAYRPEKGERTSYTTVTEVLGPVRDHSK
jgi:hypothetical protein